MTPLVADYQARISKFHPIEDVVLRPVKNDRLLTRFDKELRESDISIAMDERGRQYDSVGFSSLVSKWMNQGTRQVTFLIGGADGLPEPIKRHSNQLMALSKMTLPHRLARLLLSEQLYRALTIIRGTPYQK